MKRWLVPLVLVLLLPFPVAGALRARDVISIVNAVATALVFGVIFGLRIARKP